MKKLIVVLAVIIVCIGGCSMLKSGPTKEEMVEVLKSKEAIEAIERSLKNLDSDALTDKGIIQSYRIDYETVKWNPMGGINYTIYVNDDKMLYHHATLNKNSIDGKYRSSGSFSSDLDNLLRGEHNE